VAVKVCEDLHEPFLLSGFLSFHLELGFFLSLPWLTSLLEKLEEQPWLLTRGFWLLLLQEEGRQPSG